MFKKCVLIVLAFIPLLTQFSVSQESMSDGNRKAHSMPVAFDSARSFEHLNLIGADIQMPPFADSQMGDDSRLRRTLLKYGMALRLNGAPGYTQNVLQPPVSADQQAYVGQRPFESAMLNPILTMDLREIHLRGAQLYVSAGLQWVSWNPAGPRAATLSSLYLYKSFAEGRVEIKAGYIFNNFEFLGLQVGGSLASGGQGVYAVLPYEVGLSYFPLTTPSFNLKLIGPKNTYLKAGAQRSTDPGGGPATISRNETGLRFIPNGDKLVTIFEAGYDRQSTISSPEMWLRGGYLRNTTPYSNSLTGGTTSGNYCAFLLGDRQLTRGPAPQESSGIYVGASTMIAPADMNAYTQYYEARTYMEGPFRSRQFDTVSLVATRTIYSRDSVRSLIAQGKTYWSSSNSLTGSYSLHVSRGVYMSFGLGYITGAAITPHVPYALDASIQSSLFF